jgi:hypothetical protein
MAGDSSHPSRFAFIEFDTQEAAQQALSMSGTMLLDRPLKYANSHAIHTIRYSRCEALPLTDNPQNQPLKEPDCKDITNDHS